MKKLVYLAMAVSLLMSVQSFCFADDFQLIAREISPGFDLGERTVGALFIGKFFDSTSWEELGSFSVILDHDGKNIEVCDEVTELMRFKLIMNFNAGGRLVLVGPVGADPPPVYANWLFDDPACTFDIGCPIIDIEDYYYYVTLLSNPLYLEPCGADGDSEALIATVDQFWVKRKLFGSYGVRYKKGTVAGYLVHTPIISPAIFGIVSLQ